MATSRQSASKQLHLFGFVIHSPMNHTVGSWRHPRNNALGYSFAGPEMWQEVARTLERGDLGIGTHLPL